jgi:hypothetical protein
VIAESAHLGGKPHELGRDSIRMHSNLQNKAKRNHKRTPIVREITSQDLAD